MFHAASVTVVAVLEKGIGSAATQISGSLSTKEATGAEPQF
jgi:hypothetical protein